MEIGSVIRSSYNFNLYSIPRNLGVVLVVYALVAALYIFQDAWESNIWVIPQTIVEGWFAFTWHRKYLLGSGSGPEGHQSSNLLTRFIIRSFVFGLLGGLLIGAVVVLPLLSALEGSLVGLVIALITGFFSMMLIFRFLPYFPHIAVGGNPGVSDIWRETQGYSFRILFAHLGTYAPVLLLAIFLLYVFDDFFLGEYALWSAQHILANVFLSGVFMVMLALGVSTNSEIYRQIAPRPDFGEVFE